MKWKLPALLAETREAPLFAVVAQAAEQGQSGAKYNIGFAHFNGDGVTQNDAEALIWFRKASEGGLRCCPK